ncbi:hypothetical protein ABPG75_009426 [Micractinium tetrahymenae]
MSFDSLPDALLGRILGLAGASEGFPPTSTDASPLTLVSRRWRDCVFAEPSLWRTFRLAAGPQGAGAAPLAAKHAVLQRVAGFVQRLEVSASAAQGRAGWHLQGGDGLPVLSTFLDLLPAGQLAELQVDELQLQPGTVQQVLRFPQLQQLELAGATLPPGTGGTVRQLHELRFLRIMALQQPDGIADAAAQCGHLTCLDLQSLLMPLLELQPLSRLTCLRRLTLREEAREFTGLQQFASPEVWQLLGPMLPPEPAALPALEAFVFKSERRHVQGCSSLAPLAELSLAGCDGSTEGLAALLPQVPHLTSLAIGGPLPDATLPASVTALAQLRSLALGGMALADLPSGPYLAGLTNLELCDNSLTSLPSALAAATSLHTLNWEFNPSLVLGPQDIRLLAGLPALRELTLGLPESETPPRVLRVLRHALPLLRVE